MLQEREKRYLIKVQTECVQYEKKTAQGTWLPCAVFGYDFAKIQ